MNEKDKARLERYCELFGAVRERPKDSDIKHGKFAYFHENEKEKPLRQGPMVIRLATAKQIRFLKKLGAEIPPILTRRRASWLIDEALVKKRWRENGYAL